MRRPWGWSSKPPNSSAMAVDFTCPGRLWGERHDGAGNSLRAVLTRCRGAGTVFCLLLLVLIGAMGCVSLDHTHGMLQVLLTQRVQTLTDMAQLRTTPGELRQSEKDIVIDAHNAAAVAALRPMPWRMPLHQPARKSPAGLRCKFASRFSSGIVGFGCMAMPAWPCPPATAPACRLLGAIRRPRRCLAATPGGRSSDGAAPCLVAHGLLNRDVGTLYDIAPLFYLRVEERGKLGRSAAHRLDAHGRQARAERRLRKQFVHAFVQPIDHRFWRSLGRHQAQPSV